MKINSVIAIIISIIALGISLLHVEPFTVTEATYIGIIVSCMAVVFTALVGYQIYNSLQLKKDLEDLANKRNEMEKTINNLSEAQRIFEAYNFSSRGLFAISIQKHEDAIFLLIDSLNILLSSNDISPYIAFIDNQINNLYHCYNEMKPLDKSKMEEITNRLTIIKKLKYYNQLNNDQKGKLIFKPK